MSRNLRAVVLIFAVAGASMIVWALWPYWWASLIGIVLCFALGGFVGRRRLIG